jgi:hypothetical protein
LKRAAYEGLLVSYGEHESDPEWEASQDRLDEFGDSSMIPRLVALESGQTKLTGLHTLEPFRK